MEATSVLPGSCSRFGMTIAHGFLFLSYCVGKYPAGPGVMFGNSVPVNGKVKHGNFNAA